MRKFKVLKRMVLLSAMIFMMVIFTGCEPRQETIDVQKKSWECIVKIQKEVLCKESSWYLPERATLIEERQEIFDTKYDKEGNIVEYVYRTKYYYEIMRWKFERDVITTGEGSVTYFGEYTLKENEMVHRKISNYYIHGTNQDGKKVKYKMFQKDWKSIEEGDILEVEISIFGTLKIISNKKE